MVVGVVEGCWGGESYCIDSLPEILVSICVSDGDRLFSNHTVRYTHADTYFQYFILLHNFLCFCSLLSK